MCMNNVSGYPVHVGAQINFRNATLFVRHAVNVMTARIAVTGDSHDNPSDWSKPAIEAHSACKNQERPSSVPFLPLWLPLPPL